MGACPRIRVAPRAAIIGYGRRPDEADRILGDGWIDRGFRRYAEAWIKHPQRELLDAHKRDVDEDGMPRWHAVRELHEDGWAEYWQRPIDPHDGRESVCIGRWPEKVETDELRDAQALLEEHDDTPRCY